MRKNKAIICFLSTPFLACTATPFLCAAVQSKASNLNAKNETISYEWIPFDREKEPEKQKYHVKFDKDQKVCYIDGMHMEMDQLILQIPSSFTPSGTDEPYPIIEVNPTFFEMPGGEKEITCLDFSQASNVNTIGGFNKSNSTPRISSVIFSGASSLTKILPNAFKGQCFDRQGANDKLILYPDKQANDIDFSNTQLKEIGNNAFDGCCKNQSDAARLFRNLFFPKTLEIIGTSAFSFGNDSKKSRSLKFEDICFSTPDNLITDTLFTGGNNLPEMNRAKDYKCICWPTEAQWSKVVQIPSASQDKKSITHKSHYVSEVKIDKTGSMNLNGIAGKSGSDPSSTKWALSPQAGGILPSSYKISAELSNTYDNQIFLESESRTFRVGWKNTLPCGQYKFLIKFVAYQTDDKGAPTGPKNLLLSDVITLNINSFDVSGGSPYIYTSIGATGQDSNTWKIAANCGGEIAKPDIIKSVDFSLNTFSDFPGTIEVEKQEPPESEAWSKGQAKIKWTVNEFATTGHTYPISLNTKITFNDQNIIYIEKIFYVVIINFDYTIEVFKNDGTPVTSDGICLTTKSGTVQSEKLQVKFTSLTTEIDDDLKNQLIDSIQPSYTTSQNAIFVDKTTAALSEDKKTLSFDMTISYGTSAQTVGLSQGVYNIYIYFNVQNGEYKIPLRSSVIPIMVTNTDESFINQFSMTGGNDQLYTFKKTSNRDSSTWTLKTADNYSLDFNNSRFVSSSWTPSEKQARCDNLKLNVEKTSTNDNGYYVSWNDDFCTNSDWLDIFDCNLYLTITNSSSNDELAYVQPLTFDSFNYSEIKTDCNIFIQAIPSKEGQSDNLWSLEVNSEPNLNNSETEFDINYEKTSLSNEQLWFEYTDETKTKAYLKWSNNIPRGYYPFTVTSYTDDFYTQAESKTYFLCVQNNLELIDVPEPIRTTKGMKGSTNKPISTYLNGVKSDKAVYSLIDPPPGVSIDSNTGVISWDGTTIIGTHIIIIQSSISSEEGETDVVTKMISMTVDGGKSVVVDYSKLILILSLSGAGAIGVGVGGTFASIAINKKIKNKKRKTK